MYSRAELPSPTLQNARYMVFHILSLSPFLPQILKVLNVFWGVLGVFKVKESTDNNSKFSEA